MVGDTLRQGAPAQRTDYLQSWQLLTADRRKDRSDLPLNPAAAGSIALAAGNRGSFRVGQLYRYERRGRRPPGYVSRMRGRSVYLLGR